MRKTLKRKISMLCAVLMVALLLPFSAITAYAVDITSVDITLDIPKVGSAIPPVTVTSGDATQYTVTPDGDWKDADGGNVTYFEAGKKYRVSLIVEPVGTCTLTDATTVTVNGSTDITDFGVVSGKKHIDYLFTPQVDGTIDSVEISNVPSIIPGDSMDDYTQDEADHTINGKWQVFDGASMSYQDVPAASQFENGKSYRFKIEVTPKPGYQMNADNVFMGGYDLPLNKVDNGKYVAYKYINMGETIEYILLNDSDSYQPEAGKTFDGTSFPIAETDKYILKGSWYTVDEYGVKITSGTFTKGKDYYLEITATTNGNNVFDENCVLVFNNFDYVEHNGNYNPAKMIFTVKYSLAIKIDEVEVLDLSEPKVGDKLPDCSGGSFDVKLPQEANYTATGVWTYYDKANDSWKSVTDSNGTTTVKADVKYSVDFIFTAKDGYTFADTVFVKVMGKRTIASGLDELLYYDREFSFVEQIKRIDIIKTGEPKAGASVSTVSFGVPSGVNYKITDSYWVDKNNAGDFGSPIKVSAFENGHDYEATLKIVPEDIFEISPNVKVYVNGVKTDNYVYNDLFGKNEIVYYEDAFFAQLIDEVRVEAEDMVVGKQSNTTVKVPDGANYTADIYWRVIENNIDMPFNGIFEKGKIYTRYITITPKDGYRLNGKNTVLYVNGTKAQTEEILTFDTWISHYKEFAEGLKEITRVDVTVEKPQVNDHSSIEPVITIPEGVDYELDEYSNWIVGDEEDNIYFEGYFNDTDNYGVSFELKAKEGYRFADDVVVVVNGIVLSKERIDKHFKTMEMEYLFDMKCEHVYDNDEDPDCNVCGAERFSDGIGGDIGVSDTDPTKSPKTGDKGSVALLVMALSFMGVFMVVKGKKRVNR